MKTLAIAAAIAISVASCATWNQFEESLTGMKGQPIQTAFDVWGYPAHKQQFGEDTVYTWSSSYTGTTIVPTMSTTTGQVGRMPVSATTTGTQFVPTEYACIVKLITDDSGVIKKWQYEGNMGGCESYIRRLRSEKQ